MDPVYFKVPRHEDETVRVEQWDQPKFYEPFHYHEECQLTLILSGSGTAFISNSIVEYDTGDLFFIGENLPHVFRSDQMGMPGIEDRIRAVSVFFPKKKLLSIVDEIPDSDRINKLLDDSAYGLRIKAASKQKVGSLIQKIGHYYGFSRILNLLQIFDLVASFQKAEKLVMMRTAPLDASHRRDLNKVFDFVMLNYKGKITLDSVSALVYMTPNAFCRYFKKHTQKSFSSFVIEVRINKACKMLQDDSNSVSDSCYSSGYNNISNFHRHFRRVVGLTPNEYRKQLAHS